MDSGALCVSIHGATEFPLLRRHFFLVGAIVVLLLMAVAGVVKVALGGKGAGAGGAGQVASSGPGGGSSKGGRRGPPPTQVSVVVAQPRTFIDAIEVLGMAKGAQSVTLSAATTQLVERVHIRDGEAVAKGAVLVELKATEQNAGLAQAEAQLIQAQRAYERWKKLGEEGWAAKASIDQYEAAYLSAQADVAAARARQGDRTIRAPFSGVVGLTDIAPGALINPGAPIVTLDDLRTVRVDFSVPERYLASLREGQTIYAKADAYPGETIRGQISKLDTRVDQATRAITARAEFPNPGRRLKSGMMVRVSIARGERQGVSAPESALSMEGDRAFVYVLAQDGDRTVAEQRPVVAGARRDGFVELVEGVRTGERLVADGLNKITAGQAVRVAQKAAANRPAAADARPKA